jgi:hypothetical protein
MSGILHFINQTPVQWFAKKQATVETATYGSEFMVARQATEQILDIRYTLRMMGIPIDGPSWLFGDNQSVITSSTIPQSTLNKRHNALSYHRVRECIAMDIITFMHVSGKDNPSDVLTKFLGYTKLRPLIQPLLFWKGETLLPDTKPIPHIIHDLHHSSPSGLRGVTHNNNPSGSEQLPNPSNMDFVSEQPTIPSSTIPNTRDIASAYTYGTLTENPTLTGITNNNINIITGNPNEYPNQTDSQNSSTNSNQPNQYTVNSITVHMGNPNT